MLKFYSKKEPVKYVPPELPLPPDDPLILNLVKLVRERFINEYKNNPDLYISWDVEEIIAEDFRIRRCVQRDGEKLWLCNIVYPMFSSARSAFRHNTVQLSEIRNDDYLQEDGEVYVIF
jgi:hypothetical protein